MQTISSMACGVGYASAPGVMGDERLAAEVGRRLELDVELPLLPQVAAELMAMLGDRAADARRLSAIVHRDQALAAQVLRVANSAAYRGVAAIVSLQQAIARLGLQVLGEIAVALTVKGRVFHVPALPDHARKLWRQALATGLVGKEIARALRVNVESAFLCGLMRDVGAPLVLQTAAAVARAQKVELTAALADALIDELAPSLGARLAREWNLPEVVQAVIRHAHAFEVAGPHRRDAAVVALASTVARLLLDPEAIGADVVRDHPAALELNLYSDDVERLLALGPQLEGAMASIDA
jgi:HD-like signal output (HDOD) protein